MEKELKNSVMKHLTLLVAALLIVGNGMGQDKGRSKHEVAIVGAAGSSTIKYDSDIGNDKNGFGGLIGVGYSYELAENWQFVTGLELSFYNAKTTIDNYAEAYPSNDGQYDFEFRSKISNYEEALKVASLNIPIMVQFQLPVSEQHQFYIAGGFKVGIPLSQTYEILSSTIENSGYYPIWSDKEDLVLDTQEFMGFGTYHIENVKGDLDLKTLYMLALEAGVKWELGEMTSLYTGAYFDYGFNAAKEEEGKNLVQYNTQDPANFISNSVMQTTLVDEIAPIAVGLKVRLAFKL